MQACYMCAWHVHGMCMASTHRYKSISVECDLKFVHGIHKFSMNTYYEQYNSMTSDITYIIHTNFRVHLTEVMHDTVQV